MESEVGGFKKDAINPIFHPMNLLQNIINA
jgi:hypothetical protein